MNAYCREGASEALSRNGTTGTREARVSCSRIVGKTLMSSGLIDRIVAGLGRHLLEVPVGFRWFSAVLLDGSNHRRHRQGKLPGMEIYKYAGAHGYKNQSDGHDFVRLQNHPATLCRSNSRLSHWTPWLTTCLISLEMVWQGGAECLEYE